VFRETERPAEVTCKELPQAIEVIFFSSSNETRVQHKAGFSK